MQTALIARWLDADGRLLAWARVPVIGRDGAFYAAAPEVVANVQAAGIAESISLHWPEMNIEWRVNADGLTIASPLRVAFAGTVPLAVLGNPPAQRLPPVTVGAMVVPMQAGRLGSAGR